MKDLTELSSRTLRAGFARLSAQGAVFLIRIGSLIVLARLLDPKDFGVVSMVATVILILSLFRDFGLSSASVQRATVSKEQASTLFWINVLFGGGLTLVAFALAPAIGAFYHDPRLVWITNVIAISFLVNGAGNQHSALLQREMRFPALAMIDVGALVFGTAIAISMAAADFGYWALVAMTVSVPIATTMGLWLATKWVPRLPSRGNEIGAMMRFGGAITLNGALWTVATNLDKVLVGRYWGANAVGIYSNASQLIRMPIDNLNSAIGDVAFSALSRLQDDPVSFRRYFIKGYSLIMALTVPVTVVCAVFAEDLTAVLLGPKWKGAAEITRILAPTILVFAIANPLGWLLNALGLVARGLKIALIFAPLLVGGFLIGVPFGPKGVAWAYSTVMLIQLIPLIAWAVHGTVIDCRDVVWTLALPALASAVAMAVAQLVVAPLDLMLWPRFILESVLFGATYAVTLLLLGGRKSPYKDIMLRLRAAISR